VRGKPRDPLEKDISLNGSRFYLEAGPGISQMNYTGNPSYPMTISSLPRVGGRRIQLKLLRENQFQIPLTPQSHGRHPEQNDATTTMHGTDSAVRRQAGEHSGVRLRL